MMRKRKKKKQEIKSIKNVGFWIVNIVMGLIFTTSITLELLNLKLNYINIQNGNIINSIGVASQIISTIVTCVLSTIGLAFSLQNNEYFGIKVRDITAMRLRKHYSYLFAFLFSILILFLCICSYCASCFILCIGFGLISLIFCIMELIQEIPLLTQNQKSFLKILKDRFIKASYSKSGDSFKSTDYLRNEFDKALENLLKQKNLITVYEYFELKNKPNYNKKLMLKLLDVQQHLAFQLKCISDQQELSEICDNLKSNILDIAWGKLDVRLILGERYQDYQHYISRVMYQIINCSSIASSEICDCLLDVVFYKHFDEKDEFDKCFLLSIIISVLTSTVTSNNILFLESLKKKYTSNYFLLSSKSVSTLLFAIISVYLYYLVKKQNELSDDLKEKITDFINNSYVINNFECLSWKKLFFEFIGNFQLNYKDFITLCINNGHYLGHINFSPFAKLVIFTPEFITNWYLAILFNSERIYNFDFVTEMHYLSQGKYSHYLENFVKENFDSKEFKPTEELQDIADFYLDSNATFNYIKSSLKLDNNFLNYHDKLKESHFEKNAEIYSKIKNNDLVKKYKPQISDALMSDYGFDLNIDLSNEEEKYISAIYEKTSTAINHDECLVSSFINGIFYDIEKSIKYHIIKKDSNFNLNISKILNKKLEKYAGYLSFCEYYIDDSTVKSNFMNKIQTLIKINSKILRSPTIILKDGFSYNIQINEFSVKDLTDIQLNKIVDKYKRADGQYVYEGLFLSREKIARLIKDKYATFTIIFKYKVKTYSGSLIKIDLYPKD